MPQNNFEDSKNLVQSLIYSLKILESQISFHCFLTVSILELVSEGPYICREILSVRLNFSTN